MFKSSLIDAGVYMNWTIQPVFFKPYKLQIFF